MCVYPNLKFAQIWKLYYHHKYRSEIVVPLNFFPPNLSFVNKHVLQNNCLKHEITDVVIVLIILIVITGGFQNFQKWGGSVYELCSSLKGLSSSGVPQVPGLDPTILTCQSHHDAMWLHMVSVCLAVQINI